MLNCDFLIIGGGIAGASVAAELAGHARVVLAERESQPGYHTTGRSAAMFAPTYGPAPIRALTRASAGFFGAPPDGFSSTPLLSPRSTVFIATPDQRATLDDLVDEIGAQFFTRLDSADLERLHPLLRKGYAAAGVRDATGSDIDVAALHGGYLRQIKASGGQVLTRAEVSALTRINAGWEVTTSQGVVQAATVVNAAGSWADILGGMAGAEPIGLVPKRRTALIVAPPEGCDVADLPLIVDAQETFYMKPDAGRLLISPANEDPQAPSDAQPDEMDIAICVDRITTAFDLDVRRIERAWAGLRSFVADKSPVAGFSDPVPGFYWLAGQGGYGIQSAPALSRYAASELLGQGVPPDILDQGLDPDRLRPARLAGASRFNPDG